MCALLISVITLSGAANRSFHTTLEQWNPIGFTQASNGMTQAQSGPQTTNRLTAGSAILPTVATAAPSGELRGVSTNVITFTTAKAAEETILLQMIYTGAAPTLSGATGTPKSGDWIIYTLTSQTVTITGDVTFLNCSDNQLTALDVSQNTALTWLDCDGNQLTTLDVSKNTALTELYCHGNQIKGEEMTRLVNSLPDRTGKKAGTFTVVQEPDLEGNICLTSDVAIAKSKNWNTQKYKSDTREVVAYEGEELSPCIMSFTTANAVGKTVMLKMTYRGYLSLSGLSGTPVSGEEVIYTLTSQTVTIRGTVTVLHCSGNQLTTLDVSKNTALKWLYCYNNQLTALDVSKNTALTRLYCNNNQLTALDVSKNTALTGLYCNNNQLTALDVSKNTALTGLYCYNNQLTALDVSQNTALIWLGCTGNQIKGEEMTRLVNSLPDRTGKDAGIFTVVQEPDLEGNICLKSDVAIAKDKNWSTLKYKSDTKVSVAYEGEEPIPYAVTLTKEGEGTLTATGATDLNAVPLGTELTIEATPAEGYELTALTANGTDILATKKIVVTDNMTVKATFTKKSYTVTFTTEGEGKLTATRNGEPFTSGSPAHEGDKIVITAQPAEGYQIDKWLIGKEEIEFTPYTGQTTFECTVGTSDVLIKATFAKKTAAEVVESSSVRLYPNPASTYVNVKGAKADDLVRLYDTNGSLRYEARTDADGTLQIDLSAYAEGSYLLRVGNDAKRLLIQR